MSILELPLDRLRRRTSMKWRRYPADVLPLWVAEMDADLSPGVTRALGEAIALGDFGYPAGDAYPEAFAAFAAQRWGSVIDPAAQVRLVPDVMQGMAVAVRLHTRPGDKVVINPPVYPPFYGVLRVTSRSPVLVPLTAEGRLDLPGLEAAFAAHRPAAYLLCSPHNPNGTVHSRAELAAVASLAERYGVRVVSDEIHAPLAPPEHVPYSDVDPRGTVVTSASKSFNLAAVKAALLVGGAEAATHFGRLNYEETRGSSSHLGIIAQTAALTEDGDWLARLREELQGKRRLLQGLLAERLPRVGYARTDGTYLAWLDCRALGLEHPAEHFVTRARVALNAGDAFGAGYAGFVRLNLATSDEIIAEAVERMAASLP